MPDSDLAISVKKLTRSFKEVHVLKEMDLEVERGSITALLGPNGAGKTTTIRILSTLLLPDGGEAKVNGYDVVSESADVRASIGLTGQFAAVDEYLTGEENLHLMGRLYRLSRHDTKTRTKQLLKEFDLVEAGKRPVKTYSGGMKRRIDLAMSLIATPSVIFLDEPTTGLDPRSRLTMWQTIKKLSKSGTTILLTTQYMEEADHLADQIIVIDKGKVIAKGTPDALKSRVGSDQVEIVIDEESDYEVAKKLIASKSAKYDPERRIISRSTKGGVSDLKKLLQQLEDGGIKVESISLHRPTLDDVFLTLTGRSTEEDELNAQAKKKGKK